MCIVNPWYVANKNPNAYLLVNGFATYEICMLFANWILFLITGGHFRRFMRLFGAGSSLWRTNRVTAIEAVASHSHMSGAYCTACEQSEPERAHHCPLCSMCVKKRDHHCYFLGSCVGFFNERFFIVFCFHAATGAAFSLCMFVVFLYNTYTGLFTWSRAFMLVPPLALGAAVTGQAPFDAVTLFFLGGFHFGGIIGGGLFAVFQLYLVTRGQTSHEFSQNVKMYDAGIRKNFKATFGAFGFLNFLVPLPALRDGYEYNGLSWNYVKGRYVD